MRTVTDMFGTLTQASYDWVGAQLDRMPFGVRIAVAFWIIALVMLIPMLIKLVSTIKIAHRNRRQFPDKF
jgi:surface polysaccharide O-acyltransferase-like enzyme